MARYQVALNGAGPYYLVLYTSQSGRNVSASLYWRRDAYAYSSYNGSASWAITIAGVAVSGAVSFNAPAGGAIGETLIASRTQPISSGYTVAIAGSFNTGVTPGSASVSGQEVLPKPATAPPAPTFAGYGADQITQTSMRIRFQSTGDGGSPITSWRLERATDPLFTENWRYYDSSGTTAATDLAPGTKYYWRARGANAYGVSAWSETINASTLPGGRRKVAGAWVNVIRWVKVAGVWKRTRRWRKVAGTWVLTR